MALEILLYKNIQFQSVITHADIEMKLKYRSVLWRTDN